MMREKKRVGRKGMRRLFGVLLVLLVGGVSALNVPAKVDVAKIANDRYESLQAAVDAAGDGAMITLLSDVRESKTVEIKGKNLTVDFDGHKYEYSDKAREEAFRLSGSSVVIMNFNVITQQRTFTVDENSTLSLESGICEGPIENSGKLFVRNGTYGKLQENMPTITVMPSPAEPAPPAQTDSSSGNGTDSAPAVTATPTPITVQEEVPDAIAPVIRNNASGTVTISGGEFRGNNQSAIVNDGRALVVGEGDGIQIGATGKPAVQNNKQGSMVLTGGNYLRRNQANAERPIVIQNEGEMIVRSGVIRGVFTNQKGADLQVENGDFQARATKTALVNRGSCYIYNVNISSERASTIRNMKDGDITVAGGHFTVYDEVITPTPTPTPDPNNPQATPPPADDAQAEAAPVETKKYYAVYNEGTMRLLDGSFKSNKGPENSIANLNGCVCEIDAEEVNGTVETVETDPALGN